MNTLKKCIHCENSIDDHYRICPYCGENQDYASVVNNPHFLTRKPGQEENKIELDRPANYNLIVFAFNASLFAAMSFLLIKQWKFIPLVFLFTFASQYLLALLFYGLGRFGFALETKLSLFLDLVGDYSLPGVLLGILLLFGNFFLSPGLIFYTMLLNISLIFSASISVLLGPAKRIYLLVAGFMYLMMLAAVFIYKWLSAADLFI